MNWTPIVVGVIGLIGRVRPSRSEPPPMPNLVELYAKSLSIVQPVDTAGLTATEALPMPNPTQKQPEALEIKSYSVADSEVLAYQIRELSKELLLLEKHLAQKCKIGGRPCDCCAKHPMTIEALAQETYGMTADPVYQEVAQWAKQISLVTTPQASASGEYDEKYPELATQARELRKKVGDV